MLGHLNRRANLYGDRIGAAYEVRVYVGCDALFEVMLPPYPPQAVSRVRCRSSDLRRLAREPLRVLMSGLPRLPSGDFVVSDPRPGSAFFLPRWRLAHKRDDTVHTV